MASFHDAARNRGPKEREEHGMRRNLLPVSPTEHDTVRTDGLPCLPSDNGSTCSLVDMSSAYGVCVKEEQNLPICYVCGGPGAEYLLHCRPNRGPYFPFLESHLPPAGAEPAAPDGSVVACLLCYSFLTHQWDAHEQSGTPRPKRMYWLKRTDNGPFAGMEAGSPPAAALDLSVPEPSVCVCGGAPPTVQVYVRPVGNCPFFPSLGVERADAQGRVEVCETCHHSLLDQWDRFQQLAVAHSERRYQLSSSRHLQQGSAMPYVVPQHIPVASPSISPVPPTGEPSEAFTCFACGLEFPPSAQRTVSTMCGTGRPSFPFLRAVAPPAGARPLSPNTGEAVVCSMCYKSLLRQMRVFEIAGTPEAQRSYKILRDMANAPQQASPRKTSYLGCYLCEKIEPSDSLHPCNTRPGAGPFFPFVEELPRPIAARPMDAQGRVLLCADCHFELWRQWEALEWAGAGPPDRRRYALPPVASGAPCPACGEPCMEAPLPLSSRSCGSESPSDVVPFFPLLEGCASGEGVALVCPFCFHSLLAQWTAYESSPLPEDAVRARRRYNVHHYVCYICGITTYRKRVRPLTVREFPFVREHPRPPGAVTLPGAVVSCLTCWESLQSQWKDYERMRVPVEMRKYNWMVLPPPPEATQQEGFGMGGGIRAAGPSTPPSVPRGNLQGSTRSSGFAAALRRLAKQALEPGQATDGAEEQQHSSLPLEEFVSPPSVGSPSRGSPVQAVSAEDMAQGLLSAHRDSSDFRSSRHTAQQRTHGAEEPRGFQPYRTSDSVVVRAMRAPTVGTYERFHPFLPHLAPLQPPHYSMEDASGGFPLGLLRAPSLPPPLHVFHYPVPPEEHNGRPPPPPIPAVAPATVVSIAGKAVCTTICTSTAGGGRPSEKPREPSHTTDSCCMEQRPVKFPRNGFFVASAEECQSVVSQLDLWALCSSDICGSSDDEDEDERSCDMHPVIWSGPALPLDVRPQKVQFLHRMGLTSHCRKQKMELEQFVRHWNRLHEGDRPGVPSVSEPLEDSGKQKGSNPISTWPGNPQPQEKFLRALGLSPCSEGGTKPSGIPNGLLQLETAEGHLPVAGTLPEAKDEPGHKGPSILLGGKSQEAADVLENGSSSMWRWPGVEALMEAYDHYHQERTLECDILRERELALAQKQQHLQERAQELRARMAELLQSRQRLDEERTHLEASLEQLRACLTTS